MTGFDSWSTKGAGRGVTTGGSMGHAKEDDVAQPREAVIVSPLDGFPEVGPGDDVARFILDALKRRGEQLRDGDVIVVTSKIVAKAQGRVMALSSDPREAHEQRTAVIAQETVRVVAQRGDLLIGEARCGIIGANGGVDLSNTGAYGLVLLPEDPDGAAGALRHSLQEATGAQVAVVITDTLGRPWRRGVTDVAIGVAGMAALVDLRGTRDGDGRTLEVTEVALADEVAAASDLVKGKSLRVPAALVRGVGGVPGHGRAQDLQRRADEDLFRVASGTSGLRVFLESRRTQRRFVELPVDPALVERAVRTAATASYPHHTRPLRVLELRSEEARCRYLNAMEDAWRSDLLGDHVAETTIVKRLARSRALLGEAPVLLVPCLLPDGRHRYGWTGNRSPTPRDSCTVDHRQTDEELMFTVAAGGGVATMLLALHAEGLGAAWISSSLFCQEAVTRALSIPADWRPLGSVIAGWPDPASAPQPRPPIHLEDVLVSL